MFRAFLWSRDQFTGLGILPGATIVQATSINNRAEVAGYTDSDAFLWLTGQMTALPRLIGSTTAATDINNRGQIVGVSATHPEGYNYHAVLWTR